MWKPELACCVVLYRHLEGLGKTVTIFYQSVMCAERGASRIGKHKEIRYMERKE
jgi:hypothetical protein